MAINDDIMKQVSSFTNDAQLNDFLRNTGYSAGQLAAASGYNLGDIQARMDSVRGTGGNPYDTGPVNDDYTQKIQADLGRLNSANDTELNDYLSSTKFSPEQLAEVSGYNASDIAARMSQLQGSAPPAPIPGQDGGAKANTDNSQYLNWYKDVRDEYEKQASGPNAMTADEFADWHWNNYGKNEGRYGYNAIDPKAQAGPNEAANNPGLNSYVRDNPQLAKDYNQGLVAGTKGYTFEEYAVLDWLSKGAKEGQGISLQKNGTYGFDAPKEDAFKSQFSEDQQKNIAQFYVDKTRGEGASYGGPRAILGAMAEYGVSRQELTNAVSKYGLESIPEHSRPQGSYHGAFDTKYIDDLIDRTAKGVGLHEGFGGPNASRTKASRELTPEEQNMLDFSRALDAKGMYGRNLGNVPGAIIADSYNGRGTGAYTTQDDLNRARSLLESNAIYQRKDGTYSDARYDSGWRQDLAEVTAAEKARWRGLFDQGAGKVSPFVSGPQSGKNAPGKSAAELAPGLTVNGIRPGMAIPGASNTGQAVPAAVRTASTGSGGSVPTERLAEARRYGLDLNSLSQQELATFVNNGWAGLNQSRTAAWNQEAAARPANPNLMS